MDKVQLALGRLSPYELFTAFGDNADINTGTTPQDIWGAGGLYTGFPTGAPETVEVFSSSAADAPGGTGARTVFLSGLDENWLYQSETLTMSGATPVETSGRYRRVNELWAVEVGSNLFNVGTITARHSTTTANVFAQILPNDGQALSAVYTVPGDAHGVIQGMYGDLRRGGSGVFDREASIDMLIRPNEADGTALSFRDLRPVELATQHSVRLEFYGGGIPVEPRTDIVLRVVQVSDNGTDISGGFDVVLYRPDGTMRSRI